MIMVSKTKTPETTNPAEKAKRTRNVIKWQEAYTEFALEASHVIVLASATPKSELAKRKYAELLTAMASLIKDKDATGQCISACDNFELVLDVAGLKPEPPRVSLPVIDACHKFINLFVDKH